MQNRCEIEPKPPQQLLIAQKQGCTFLNETHEVESQHACQHRKEHAHAPHFLGSGTELLPVN